MTKNFLSLFNDSNSIKDETTGEIIITAPKIANNGSCEINTSCKIKSNCNTVITGDILEITTPSVSISGISFEMSVRAKNINGFTMNDCTITKAKTGEGSLVINNCENVTLSHITITDSVKLPGLYVNGQSVVSADNITVHDLTETLVVCNTGSYLTVTDSTLHHTQANGVFSSGQSYIEIRNTSFSDTKYPAVYVTESQMVLINDSFQNTDQNALGVYKSTDFVVEKCTFKKICGTAIQICDQSTGVINENRISDIEGNGVYSTGNSKIECKNNKVTDISYPAFALTNQTVGSLFGNEIRNIKFSGICVRGAKHVKIEGTHISLTRESGISISDTEECEVVGNRIEKCDIASIEGYNQSRVTICDNDISDIGKYGFLAYTSGYMKAENNRIEEVGKAIVKLAYKGGGEFINNRVANCANQCQCETSSPYFFSGNGNLPGVTNIPEKVSDTVRLDEPYVDHNSLCLKCNKKPRDYYLIECGHKVYCKDCAELALKNHENCPLCRFPIVNVSSGFGASNEDTCIICCEKKSDCIILPCGHMGCCSSCLENWFKNKQCCPICRSEPSFFKKIINDI